MLCFGGLGFQLRCNCIKLQFCTDSFITSIRESSSSFLSQFLPLCSHIFSFLRLYFLTNTYSKEVEVEIPQRMQHQDIPKNKYSCLFFWIKRSGNSAAHEVAKYLLVSLVSLCLFLDNLPASVALACKEDASLCQFRFFEFHCSLSKKKKKKKRKEKEYIFQIHEV